MPGSQFEFKASLVFAASEGRETQPSVTAFVQSPAWFLWWIDNDSHRWAPPPGKFSLPRAPPGGASPWLGDGGSQAETWGAEPIVHKDETLSSLIYSSIEMRTLPARNQCDSTAMPSLIFKFSELCFLLRWPQVCLCISQPLLFPGAVALIMIQTSERCAEEMQKYNADLDSLAQF